jgi:hypothetical protein
LSRRRPLSRRDDPGGSTTWDGPFEGTPGWLVQSLVDWTSEFFLVPNTLLGTTVANRDRLQAAQRYLHIEQLLWTLGNEAVLQNLIQQATRDPDLMLDLVDWCLGISQFNADYVVRLETVLLEAGSAWRVGLDGNGAPELQRRVADAVQSATLESAPPGSRAARHLSTAWSHVYGRQPDPSSGYREAVRAVEAAAIPIVSPNHMSATLGSVLGELRARPSRWTLTLRPIGASDPMVKVIGMIELLWKAQLDRHGTPDPDAPFSVSQEEAEAAVHLAATLVHWFSNGGIRASHGQN